MPKGLTDAERRRAERFSRLRASPGHQKCSKEPDYACENCCKLIFARAALRLDKEIAELTKKEKSGHAHING